MERTSRNIPKLRRDESFFNSCWALSRCSHGPVPAFTRLLLSLEYGMQCDRVCVNGRKIRIFNCRESFFIFRNIALGFDSGNFPIVSAHYASEWFRAQYMLCSAISLFDQRRTKASFGASSTGGDTVEGPEVSGDWQPGQSFTIWSVSAYSKKYPGTVPG